MVRPGCEVELNDFSLTLTKTAQSVKNSAELFHKAYEFFYFLQAALHKIERKWPFMFCKMF